MAIENGAELCATLRPNCPDRSRVAVFWMMSDDPAASLKRANEFAAKAVSLDPGSSAARYALSRDLHATAASGNWRSQRPKQSISLNPNSQRAHFFLALALMWDAQPTDAIPHIDISIELSPKGPFAAGQTGHEGRRIGLPGKGRMRRSRLLVRRLATAKICPVCTCRFGRRAWPNKIASMRRGNAARIVTDLRPELTIEKFVDPRTRDGSRSLGSRPRPCCGKQVFDES